MRFVCPIHGEVTPNEILYTAPLQAECPVCGVRLEEENKIVTIDQNLAASKPQLIHPSHFVAMVENCPLTWQELVAAIKEATERAHAIRECVVIGGYAGMFDIVVSPNGSFAFVPIAQFRHYSVVEVDGRTMFIRDPQ